MEKLLSKIIRWVAIIMIAMLLVIIFLIGRSCDDRAGAGELREEIALRDKLIQDGAWELEVADKRLEIEQRAHDRKIGELNGMIDSSNTVIARLTEEDATKAKRMGELEALHPESPEEEIIDNWQKRTELWKNRFSLCQNVVVEKDKIIFSVTGKYETELRLRLQVDDSLSDYKTQVSLLETQLQTTASLTAKLERKLKWNKQVKTASVLAFALAVVYLVVRK